MVTAKFGINCYKKDNKNKKISKQDKEKKTKTKSVMSLSSYVHPMVTFCRIILSNCFLSASCCAQLTAQQSFKLGGFKIREIFAIKK